MKVGALLGCALLLGACYDTRAPSSDPQPAAPRERVPDAAVVSPVELRGPEANALFGMALITVPDVSGDGLADLMVGAPGARQGRGDAYLLGGPFTEDQDASAALLAIQGERSAGRAGESLAAGDSNGDGVLELAIGSPQSGQGQGAVDLVSARERGEVSLAAVVSDAMPPPNLGLALAFAASRPGLLSAFYVGAPHAGRDFEGGVLMFRDAPLGALSSEQRVGLLSFPIPGAHAGTALAADCDVDADAASDLLVGAWGDDSGSTGGSAYLFRGPVSASGSLDAVFASFHSSLPGAGAGTRVLLADLDGDARCDVVIGAPGESAGAGAVYGFLAPAAGRHELSDADFRILGAAAGDGIGMALAAGDHDGDGVPELWLGAPGHDRAGPESGAVYVLAGPPRGELMLSAREPTWLGLRPDDHLGAALAAGHDLDGDGTHDLAVGAWGADAPEGNSGAVYVFRNPAGAR